MIAVPRAGGHVVLDMAMSQFSYGALESYRKRGEKLPVDGGFDKEGNLTRDPGAIEQSQRARCLSATGRGRDLRWCWT